MERSEHERCTLAADLVEAHRSQHQELTTTDLDANVRCHQGRVRRGRAAGCIVVCAAVAVLTGLLALGGGVPGDEDADEVIASIRSTAASADGPSVSAESQLLGALEHRSTRVKRVALGLLIDGGYEVPIDFVNRSLMTYGETLDLPEDLLDDSPSGVRKVLDMKHHMTLRTNLLAARVHYSRGHPCEDPAPIERLTGHPLVDVRELAYEALIAAMGTGYVPSALVLSNLSKEERTIQVEYEALLRLRGR